MSPKNHISKHPEENHILNDSLYGKDLSALHSEIENLITEGDTCQAVALLNLFFQKIEQDTHKNTKNSLQRPKVSKNIATLERQLAKTKKTLKRVIACLQTNHSTFAKLNAAIKLLLKITDFNQFPSALETVTKEIQTGFIGILLDQEKYADFIPATIPTLPQQNLRTILDEIRQNGTHGQYIGPISLLTNGRLLLQFLPDTMQKNSVLGSWIVYPFFEKKQETYLAGFIYIYDPDPTRYSPTKATDYIEHVCHIVGYSISVLRTQKLLDRELSTDPLTGIPNRAYLMEYGHRILKFAERKNFPVTLLFIDLNGFKELNDQLGHNKGDIALQQVAQCLKGLIRKYDMVVRLGGDEFVILLPGVAMYKTADLLGRMAATIENIPLNKEYSQSHLTASIGAAAYTPGQTLEELMAVADQAMYANKKQIQR